MNPLLAFLFGEIVKQAPALAIEIIQLFSRGEPTQADWDALKAKYSGRTYQDYDPDPLPVPGTKVTTRTVEITKPQ